MEMEMGERKAHKALLPMRGLGQGNSVRKSHESTKRLTVR